MADDEEVPIFPPPKKGQPSLREMYRRDNASRWHQEWGGTTSAQVRLDREARLREQERLRQENAKPKP